MEQIDPLIFSKQTYHFYMAAYFTNFTKAANYLQIDQSAISHSVKFLEKKIGAALFERQHRGVKLTEKGRMLFESLQISQTSIGLTLEEIRNQDNRNQVTLAMSNATAINVILPSLTYFKVRHPQLEIRCVINEFDPDFSVENIDLAIPLGIGPWRNCQQWRLAEERICAVASPKFMMSLQVPIKTPYDLARERLIHLIERKKSRCDWRDWLAYFDKSLAPSKPEIACNDYSIVLQMAIDGQGIALGWNYLVEPLIEQGKLIKVIPHEVKTGYGFDLITKHSNPLPKSVEVLKDWIVNEVFAS